MRIIRQNRTNSALIAAILAIHLVLAGSAQSSFSDQPSLSLPDTPAVDQLTWVLDQVNNGGTTLTALRIDRRFTESFRSGLPADQIIAVLQGYVAPSGPMSVARFEGGATRQRANALLTTPSGLWRVQLAVEATEPYRIDALFFEPVYQPEPVDPPQSWSELKRRLADIAPRSGFFAAEVTSGSCDPIARVQVNSPLAIASVFKIYVLGALAQQIQEGSLDWNDLVTMQSDLVSLPNGDLRYEPAGERFSVEYVAEQMMSKSDNTATDHLIGLLGRQIVEQAMVEMDNEHAELNIPLMMTREWFAIRMRFSDDDIARYISSGEDDRREILQTDAANLAGTLAEWEPWPAFRAISSIEWFASPADLCRGIAHLKDLGVQSGLEPVLNALSLEPGITFDPEVWSYVGYKAGYETGVHSNVWILQRNDGRWFVLAAVINDPSAEIDGIGLLQLMQSAGDLLATID